MTRTALAILALALAGGPAGAEDLPPFGSTHHSGSITLGGQATDLDSNSSIFEQYRRVPDGVVAPGFRLFGRTDELEYDFHGYTIRSDDLRYTLRTDFGDARLRADYTRLPHYFGNDGRMLFSEQGDGAFVLGTGLQQRYQSRITSVPQPAVSFDFLSDLVTPDLGAAAFTDLRLVRGRARVDLDLLRGRPVEVTLSYFREDRNGDRAAAGAAFGFGNVVELPEPVDYVTQDVSARATADRSWGSLRASLHYNWFTNAIPVMTFANPFRAVDSTDSRAYLGPGAASVAGPALGRLALPPDNGAFTGAAGATFRLPGRTRLVADLSYGRWSQDSTPFIPYTTNTAITAPVAATDPAALPARRLDGKADVFSQAWTVSSRPVGDLTLTARVRRYDFRNETPRLAFPGYVRFDGTWQDTGRISVPYDFRSDRLDATASYDLGRLTLEAGYKRVAFHRTFRETEETVEDGVVLAASLRPRDGVILRGSWEIAERSFDEYHADESEHASFTEPGPPTNLLAVGLAEGGPVPGRFDQARKDIDRFSGLLQVTPGDRVSVSLSYLYARDNYNDFDPGRFTADTNLYGLNRASYGVFAADLDYTPAERVNLFAFYSRETNKNWQRGRQSGGTVSLRPLDDWFSFVADEVDSVGGGAGLALLPGKLDLRLTGQYQNVDGSNEISAPVGGAPELAKRDLGGPLGFEAFDDTEIVTLRAEATYTLPRSWAVTLGAWYEDYTYQDPNAVPLNYVPGGLFLNANNGSYDAFVGYLRLSYRW